MRKLLLTCLLCLPLISEAIVSVHVSPSVHVTPSIRTVVIPRPAPTMTTLLLGPDIFLGISYRHNRNHFYNHDLVIDKIKTQIIFPLLEYAESAGP